MLETRDQTQGRFPNPLCCRRHLSDQFEGGGWDRLSVRPVSFAKDFEYRLLVSIGQGGQVVLQPESDPESG